MAVLSDADRKKMSVGYQRFISPQPDEYPRALVSGWTKAELRTAVNETDVWIDNNQSGYKTALSEPVKSAMGAAQLTLLFACVALMRHDPALVKKILGELD